MYGRDGDDSIFGEDGNDTIYGGVNEYGGGYGDTLDGGAGADTLYGDDGLGTGYGGDADDLYGGTGNDTLYGEDGDDDLDGGSGIDSVDGGGQTGDVIEDRPVIIDFDVEPGVTTWVFSGTVVDDGDVEGLTVTFGGLLAGYTAIVNSNGVFTIEVSLDPDIYGTASAQVTDVEALTSDSVLVDVET